MITLMDDDDDERARADGAWRAVAPLAGGGEGGRAEATLSPGETAAGQGIRHVEPGGESEDLGDKTDELDERRRRRRRRRRRERNNPNRPSGRPKAGSAEWAATQKQTVSCGSPSRISTRRVTGAESKGTKRRDRRPEDRAKRVRVRVEVQRARERKVPRVKVKRDERAGRNTPEATSAPARAWMAANHAAGGSGPVAESETVRGQPSAA
ncbi:hypothetical protein VTO42DRAFT_108 [Malbranchea cinnamomea]